MEQVTNPNNYFKVSIWSDVPPPETMFDACRVEGRRRSVKRAGADHRRAYTWIFPFRSGSEVFAFGTAFDLAEHLDAVGYSPRMSVYDARHGGNFTVDEIGVFQEQDQEQELN